METRQTKEVKVYILVLNDMRKGKDHNNAVAYSYEKEKLIEWYKLQIDVKADKDSGKAFKIGSFIKWYNPIDSFEKLTPYNHGIHEEWVTEEAEVNFPWFKVV